MGRTSKQGPNAGKIFFKTMPFVWAKLLLGIATIVISVIILAIFLGIAWLFNSEIVGLVMLILWIILTGVIRFIINHYIGYLIKVGHIAVITEAVTSGDVPEHQVRYGMQVVKERFLTANVYFVIDKLVAAAVKQLQRVIGKITGTMSKLRVPGMNAVSNLAQFFVSISLGYIDECCLGYTFHKKKQSAFKSAADGVVIYAQNIKILLASAAKTMLIVVIAFIVITLVMFAIVAAVFRLTPLANSEYSFLVGFVAFLIAVILTITIKYAFMDSLILIRTMVTYMEVAPTTKITVDIYGNLCKASTKFRELFNKGQEEEGKPQVAASKSSSSGTSLMGMINKEKPKTTASSGTGDSAFCSKCGNKIDKGAKFCGSCGAPTQQKAKKPSASGTAAKKTTKK